MAVIAYLNFKTESREAVKFYEEALDGYDVRIMTLGELPEDSEFPMDEATKALIANASVKFAGGMIMLSDVPEGMGMTFTPGNNFCVSIVIKDKVLAEKYFNNLAAGGQVIMPLMEVSWSPLYGALKDKFGITWQVNVAEDDYYFTYK
ncbi:VOC family protein [Culicoidibacter larvae]|uniref:VOC family protein n=1 Tax=Culicoidibacter larvae TaxID=2579976 RepID=A0A5R8Q9A4_9FIRM|nr:VOC family protein [Culicoidibacter larvae]TLG72503.1 VOC family protein [Culicoidibacter larvae]